MENLDEILKERTVDPKQKILNEIGEIQQKVALMVGVGSAASDIQGLIEKVKTDVLPLQEAKKQVYTIYNSLPHTTQ